MSIDRGRKVTSNGGDENFFWHSNGNKKRFENKKYIYRREKRIEKQKREIIFWSLFQGPHPSLEAQIWIAQGAL